MSAFTYKDIVAEFEAAYDWSGTPSDDSGLSEEEIIADIHKARSMLIHRDKKVSPNHMYRDLYQDIFCIPLDDVAVEECPCMPPSNCKWKRTRYKVPGTIGNLTNVVSSGGNLKQVRHYEYVEWTQYRDVPYSRFKAEREAAYYTRRNGYAYLISGEEDFEKFLAVRGIFEDPLALYDLPDCDGKIDYCTSPLDREFVFDPARQDEVIKIAMQMQLTRRNSAPHDLSNDDNAAVNPEQSIPPL